MRHFLTHWCLAAGLALTASVPVHAADAGFEEVEVKAAFIFNLVKFVEWPKEVMVAGTPFRLCHEGVAVPQAKALAKLEGKSVQGMSLRVQAVGSAGSLKGCHAVMLGPNSTSLLQQSPDGVLTIGESGFVEEGGMIGLVVDNGKVVLEFNVESARRAHLRVPAQVLQLGRKVKGR